MSKRNKLKLTLADLKKGEEAVIESFSDEEIGALTATIGMINLWNRIQVSAH